MFLTKIKLISMILTWKIVYYFDDSIFLEKINLNTNDKKCYKKLRNFTGKNEYL